MARLLGVPLHQLTWWVWALKPSRRYNHFAVVRRRGGTRRISAPIKPIKDVQHRLAQHLTEWYQPPPQVHGFVPGRSPISNARPHRRQHWVLRIDLEDFFPSINFGRVRGMFLAYPFEYPEDVATLLAQVCCHNNELPQGAPTSPIVSNYICRRMDTKLGRLGQAERCYYTRYADDVTFSTDRTTFPAALGAIEGGRSVAGPAITEIIRGNGFTINEAKTHLMRETQRQRVTGLVVNRKTNIPRDYIRSIRNLLYIWKRYGESDAMSAFERTSPHPNWPPDKSPPDFKSVIKGRVQYVGSVKGWNSPVYVRLAAALRDVDVTFGKRELKPVQTQSVRLFTEGETDMLHMAAAQRYFHARGEFLELELVPETYSDQPNDDRLLSHCESLAVSKQENCCICLFDRDKPRTLKQAVGPSDWKNHGNGVAAVALLPPPWVNDEKVCIEVLYQPEVLAREDAAGRRIFLSSEFDETTGQHIETDGDYNVPNAKTDSLVRPAVYERGGRQVALSKKAFAQGIHNSTTPFEDVSFDGFRPTFEIIQEAVREIAADLL